VSLPGNPYHDVLVFSHHGLHVYLAIHYLTRFLRQCQAPGNVTGRGAPRAGRGRTLSDAWPDTGRWVKESCAACVVPYTRHCALTRGEVP
jgi:hypothetical protein